MSSVPWGVNNKEGHQMRLYVKHINNICIRGLSCSTRINQQMLRINSKKVKIRQNQIRYH